MKLVLYAQGKNGGGDGGWGEDEGKGKGEGVLLCICVSMYLGTFSRKNKKIRVYKNYFLSNA